jgi:hypothetical protein
MRLSRVCVCGGWGNHNILFPFYQVKIFKFFTLLFNLSQDKYVNRDSPKTQEVDRKNERNLVSLTPLSRCHSFLQGTNSLIHRNGFFIKHCFVFT